MQTRLLIVTLCAAGLVGPALANPPPWQRTETRAACSSFDTLRAPFFGETHVHTTLSFDALVGDVRTGPREAYQFAQGAPIELPPYDAFGSPQRSAQLRRPLDFAVITDHSELFGEMRICQTPGHPNYNEPNCVLLRDELGTAVPLPPPQQPNGIFVWAFPYSGVNNPSRAAFCGVGGSVCLGQASLVWQEIQDAAEEFYDRSAACGFTSFVGYEWTKAPFGVNHHRNVIFRNAVVPPLPISYIEQQTAQGLWGALQSQCIDGLPGCDVLAIPHNTNLSRGQMMIPENADGSPLTAADAGFRAAMEPLIEITQHKGDSECRTGVLTSDEECNFEKLERADLAGIPFSGPPSPRAFVRNALKEGLAEEQRIGVNPFRLGLVGSTDSHNSTPGLTDERDFAAAGALGTRDATPAFMASAYPLGGMQANAGGLAVVWAEENSRDAIFSAMRRREVYGTSGSRPIVRFFGGRLQGVTCGASDFVARGYGDGVPMGAELGPVRAGRSPRFAVLAMQDPGDPGDGGTPLQRVQIIKGWVDASGQTQEKVFDVAGDAANGASVDLSTCAPTGTGSSTLCTVWEDPEFDRGQRAFYYARVLENPTCRWSTRLCNAQGIDCSVPAAVPPAFAECCNPLIQRTIQERAWTSPIWYRPEGIANLRGRVHYAERAGADRLRFRVRLGSVPATLDVAANGLRISVRDDDTIFEVTIPPGAMVAKGPQRFVYKDRTGTLVGLRFSRLTVGQAGEGVLQVRTGPLDLARADRSEHMVNVEVISGEYRATHARLWKLKGDRLFTR